EPVDCRTDAGGVCHRRAERDPGSAAIWPWARASMTGQADGALLEVSGLGKRFFGFVALEAIELAVREGERVGLIGPNGSGKSTLVNCVCGTLGHEAGSVRFAGQTLDGLSAHERTRLGLARSFQLPPPFNTLARAHNLRFPLH